MRKLTRLQHYGLVAMFGGFAAYLLVALLIPHWRSLWISFWVISFAGAVAYVWGAVPSVVAWLKRLLRSDP
jgi:hypothetical protein